MLSLEPTDTGIIDIRGRLVPDSEVDPAGTTVEVSRWRDRRMVTVASVTVDRQGEFDVRTSGGCGLYSITVQPKAGEHASVRRNLCPGERLTVSGSLSRSAPATLWLPLG